MRDVQSDMAHPTGFLPPLSPFPTSLSIFCIVIAMSLRADLGVAGTLFLAFNQDCR